MRKSVKVKKASKGRRWKKGDSCASNPSSSKHRDLVKRSVIHGKRAKGGLTAAALEKHNEKLEEEDDNEFMASESGMSEHSAFSKVSRPFSISGLTDCTNVTFNKVLRMWSSPSEQSRQICAVLAAVTEVIRSKGGSETEVEYFGALMTALSNVPADDRSTTAAIIFLLSLAIKQVPVAILRMKFSETSKVFSDQLIAANKDGNTSLLKNVIYILSVLLTNQDSVVWADSSSLQMFHLILSFADCPKPKVRKAAHSAVRSILKIHLANAKHHPAGLSTSSYCIKELERHGGGDGATSLHILNLLKQTAQFFSPESIKKVCETILKLMTLGSTTTKISCLGVFESLFRATPSDVNLPAALNGKIISALYDFQPSVNDSQVAQAWLATMEAAYANLSILDERICFQSLPRFYSSIMAYMLSDFREVSESASKVTKLCLEKCIVPMTGLIIEESSPEIGQTFQAIFRLIESGLKYKYHTVWDLILPVIAAFIREFGKVCSKVMIKSIITLCDLHESHNFPCISELEKTVGTAIQYIGPRAVLEAVPLGLDRSDGKCDFPKSWLLPVLAEHVKNTELHFFTSYFLPLAATLRERAAKSSRENLPLEAKVYDTLQQQIWSLLPGFCSNATDVAKSFKNIARILGTALSEQADLRANVMLSLRTLINSTEDEEGKAEISKYCKNFLPILFNLYTQEEADSQVILPTILETVKTFLMLADSKLISTFATKTLEKISQENDSAKGKKKCALMDLLIVFTMYLDEENVEKVYRLASPLLKEKDKTVQKKAYRILEEICTGRKEGCSNFLLAHLDEIKSLLCASLSSSAPSSKAPRLRCLACIIRKLSKDHLEFIMSLLPEVILCTKEVGSKARAAAFGLLVELCNTYIYFNDKPKEDCIESFALQVMAGFGGSPHMRSATLISLTRLTQEYKDSLKSTLLRTLIGAGIDLLKSKDREVAKAALLYIRKLIAISDISDISGYSQSLVEALFHGKDEKKNVDKHERQVVLEKLIRKLGYSTVHAMTPDKHRRFVASIHKVTEKNRKLKRERKLKIEHEGTVHKTKKEDIDELLEDSDLEDDIAEEAVAKMKKSKSWILETDGEETIDLLDPKASKFVVGTRPRNTPKKKKRDQSGFQLSADGKWIIKDEDDDEKGAFVIGPDGSRLPEKIKLGKRKHADDGGNSDDDNEEEGSKAKSVYTPGGTGIHRPLLKAKRRKVGESQGRMGSEYRAKKAKGDIKLKGRPDPYAYIPLDKRKLNKRKQAKLSGQFQGFVKAAKRGAAKGKKSRPSAR